MKNKLLISVALIPVYCFGMSEEMLRLKSQLENQQMMNKTQLDMIGALKQEIQVLKKELQGKETLHRAYDRELVDVKLALQKSIVGGKADAEKLQETIDQLSKHIEHFKQEKKMTGQKTEAYERWLTILHSDIAEQEKKAKEAEDRMMLENTKLLNRVTATEKFDNQEIAQLKLNIELLQNRLQSQRARADKLWVELQALQEKPVQAGPVTRFLNWLRGRRQQTEN